MAGIHIIAVISNHCVDITSYDRIIILLQDITWYGWYVTSLRGYHTIWGISYQCGDSISYVRDIKSMWGYNIIAEILHHISGNIRRDITWYQGYRIIWWGYNILTRISYHMVRKLRPHRDIISYGEDISSSQGYHIIWWGYYILTGISYHIIWWGYYILTGISYHMVRIFHPNRDIISYICLRCLSSVSGCCIKLQTMFIITQTTWTIFAHKIRIPLNRKSRNIAENWSRYENYWIRKVCRLDKESDNKNVE